MGGFSSVTSDETIMFADNVSFNGTQRGGKVTTDGQLLIGATSAPHIKVGSITSPDSSITVGYATPNITLQATFPGGYEWIDASGALSPTVFKGYFITGTTTATMPASPSQGDTVKFFVDHASQFLTIQAAAGQSIRMGNLVSSVAGSAVSTDQGDSCELVFRSSNSTWEAVTGLVGTWVIS